MIRGSIARRYARALFESVGEDFERAATDLDGLSRGVAEVPAMEAIWADPTIPSATKRELVEKLVSTSAPHPMVANLLRLLAQRDRLQDLPAIASVFRELTNERLGKVQAEITAAIDLSDAELTKLRDVLSQATSRQVEVSVRKDPSILGGLVAQVGSTVFDGSLRTQLEAMRRDLGGSTKA